MHSINIYKLILFCLSKEMKKKMRYVTNDKCQVIPLEK